MHDSSATDPFDDTGADAGEGVRVVLVGRTGLDAALRLDRNIELIRARTPMSALGELANPIDAESPDPTVVVVGPDAVPSAPGRTHSFVAALHRIDPDARILAVEPADASIFDGLIPHTAPAELVRALIHNGASAPASRETPPPVLHGEMAELGGTRQERVRSTDPRGTATPRPLAQPSPPIPALTDAPLLSIALRGGDVAAAALSQVRERLPSPNARLDPPSPSLSSSTDGAAPIIFGRNSLGTLVAPGVPATQLEAEATWIAPWIMLARQHEQLRAAAFTDELTGAWNRRYFRRFLTAAIEQARQARHAVTVLFFDIDDFKRYNDAYGHAAGDEILVNAVRLLTSVIRPTDRVCRIGGDEFAVIFHDPEGPRAPDAPGASPDASTADARPRPTFAPPTITEICQRFQKQICAHRFPQLAEDAPGRLSISGGLATYPWDGSTVEALLARADQLALQSKKQGKNAIILGPNGECARGD